MKITAKKRNACSQICPTLDNSLYVYIHMHAYIYIYIYIYVYVYVCIHMWNKNMCIENIFLFAVKLIDYVKSKSLNPFLNPFNDKYVAINQKCPTSSTFTVLLIGNIKRDAFSSYMSLRIYAKNIHYT